MSFFPIVLHILESLEKAALGFWGDNFEQMLEQIENRYLIID